ncbi:hypothetical protein C1H46_044536 [Malus baccata]|uniref:Uncharacterized protein n=1 Tax=Malus baccata TaxID=106549 RepID=A0A540K7R5_MALBA|nr:hypothetical protein C1H46_044536 [Malus baccata]
MVTMVELEEQGPAMRVLGSLFKLTEVFLCFGVLECGILQEDMELTKQMNALGLPVPFNTNKEKRKGMRLKQPDCSQDVVRGAMESSKVSEGEIVSPIIFDGHTSTSLCCFPVMGPSESSSSGVAADVTKCQCSSGQGDSPASLIEMNCDAVKAQNHDEISGIV